MGRKPKINAEEDSEEPNKSEYGLFGDSVMPMMNETMAKITNCIFLKDLKIKPIPQNVPKSPMCIFMDGEKAVKAHIFAGEDKAGFEEHDKVFNFCDFHSENNYLGCGNPNIPFLLAPCRFFVSRKFCQSIRNVVCNDELNPVRLYPNREKRCRNIQEIKYEEAEDNRFCFICYKKATKKFQHQHGNMEMVHYVCDRHAEFKHSCRSRFMPFCLAVCELLEPDRVCTWFEQA